MVLVVLKSRKENFTKIIYLTRIIDKFGDIALRK